MIGDDAHFEVCFIVEGYLSFGGRFIEIEGGGGGFELRARDNMPW